MCFRGQMMKFLKKLSRVYCIFSIFIFTCLILIAPRTIAAQASVFLDLSPSQCVAVRQGNNCFADVEVEWQSQQSDNLCLYSSQQSVPIKCWSNSTKGVWVAEVQTKTDLTFFLKRKNDEKILARQVLEIAWVYKKNVRRTSSWRMF